MPAKVGLGAEAVWGEEREKVASWRGGGCASQQLIKEEEQGKCGSGARGFRLRNGEFVQHRDQGRGGGRGRTGTEQMQESGGRGGGVPESEREGREMESFPGAHQSKEEEASPRDSSSYTGWPLAEGARVSFTGNKRAEGWVGRRVSGCRLTISCPGRDWAQVKRNKACALCF